MTDITPEPAPNPQSSLMVVTTHTQQEKHNEGKKIIMGILLLLLFLAMGIVWLTGQEYEPVAEIRKFAQEPDPSTEIGDTATNDNFSTFVFGIPKPTTAKPLSSRTNPKLYVQSTPTAAPTPTAATVPVSTIGTTVEPTAIPMIDTFVSQPTSTPPVSVSQPTSTPPASVSQPTSTTQPMLSCQRVELFRGSERMTQRLDEINYGDTIHFLGYVTDTGQSVTGIVFRHSVNDTVIQTPTVPAVKIGDEWVADYSYTFATPGAHRVMVKQIIFSSL